MIKKIVWVLLFLLSSSLYSAQSIKNPQYTVIIIGAGIAGLEAARYLEEHGLHDYIILEARDRIGGRIWTVHPQKDIAVDLGATWIHGDSAQGPLMQLVNQWHLDTQVVDPNSAVFYTCDGNEISSAAEKSFFDLYGQFAELLREKRQDPVKNALLSVSDVAIEFITAHQLAKEKQYGLLYTISDKIEQEYAADIKDLSALWYDNEKEIPGSDRILVQGYKSIIDGVARDVKGHIFLNQAVKQIDYRHKQSIIVTTQKGQQYTGQYVISTLPLGVLKKGSVRFLPALPADKLAAIHHLNMGVMNKIILFFPVVFWDQVQYISYLSPAYWSGTKWKNKSKWIEFDSMAPFLHQPILFALVSGDFAQELENKTDEEIVNGAMTVLRTMYGEKIPPPTQYIITRWGQDPCSVGSYSSLRPGALDNGGDYLNLAKTIDGRLLFAGEATTNIYPSTVYGAYLTGDRAAQEVLSNYSAARVWWARCALPTLHYLLYFCNR